MSNFKTEVVRVEIEEHPNADRLEIAKVGDYKSIVAKGQFRTGDKAVYVQEGSIIPEDVLMLIGLSGKLAGPQKNRVKAMKLRGVLSQGLVIPANADWREGDDVSGLLGIEKYEPPIPTSMRGEVTNVFSQFCFKYDIENLKRYPNLFESNEEVVITEKIHGTFMVIGLLPHTAVFEAGLPERAFVSSKGLFAKGLAIDADNSVWQSNVYLRAVEENDLATKMLQTFYDAEYPMYLMGEVYGIQDLKYGLEGGKLGFRAFDMGRKAPDGSFDFADDDIFEEVLDQMGIERVPVLYRGPYNKDVVQELTSGRESVSGSEAHIREGVVIKPLAERYDPRYGRVILKSVSDNYLLRKNGTEMN